ncbi:hypothetical protein [Lysobacter tyrosinilyticus]
MLTWPEIFARFPALAAEMPKMKSEYRGEADFFPAFAGIAERIQDDADRVGDDASERAWVFPHNLLVDHGRLPEHERQM